MEEEIVPTGGPMWLQTRETIERNGGNVGPTETVLRNIQDIQEVRPYSNANIKAKKVIFNSGEYVYYNEKGIWTDLQWPSSQNL